MTPRHRSTDRRGSRPYVRLSAQRRLGVVLAWLATLGFVAVAEAEAAPGKPLGLSFADGNGSWQHHATYSLTWRNPAGTEAVGYRVTNPAGAVVESGRLGRLAEHHPVRVPKVPAIYTAEVWAEDAAGAPGPAATLPLRFDHIRPGRLPDPAAPTWLGRASFPLRLHLGLPPGTPPLSGITGYALALTPSPVGHPCPGEGACERARVLPGTGPGGDAVTIRSLPEGRHHLAVVAVSGSGLPAREPGRTVLTVDATDPTTVLEGAPNGWSPRPLRLRARATDNGSGMEPLSGLPAPFTAIQVGERPPILAAGASAATVLIEEGIHTIAHYARDAAGNVADGSRLNGVANRQPAVTVVRIDRTPPRPAFAAPDPRDPELIRALVADELSGPAAAGWIGVRPAGSRAGFERLPAAPADAGELRARWNSGAQRPGRYEFRAFARDRAGNAGAGGQRVRGGTMALVAPLKAATRLRAGLRGRGERAVRFGRGAVFAGRLGTGVTGALPGATLRVVERFAPGVAAATRTTAVTTDASGRFRLRLAPGPSREVSAEFGGSPTQMRASSERSRLGVRGSVRLRASARVARVGGAPIVFHGRVAAGRGEVPPGGKSVQLQFKLPGLEWSEFRTVHTDRHGRFRYAYRFNDDDSRGVRFLFRAHAPAQAGWPYEPGSSWPLAISGG